MRLASMNQLAISVKEALGALTIDNQTEVNEEVSTIQNSYMDSVEFSDRAIQLSMGLNTETYPKNEADTEQRREENPVTDQGKDPAVTGALSLNVLA
ncbi:chemotaxis protein histidine kinase and related kinases [Candidatus Scalindua japonica]|uniref:Chemotaxis protein histidine kinase and related kinases n=1 Tax=Candidatus Scalindua japonica TaxID=1284222 RepID=A0A286U4L0_9BACT|nr:hypothetical protein [Candidatus Scalindua japonica]GAX63067.1 chemotaxis protein histidine kinase and related kinases [Candidatus Scalindua japonica]